MTGYQSKKKAASAKTIDQVNWVDHEPDGRRAAQEPVEEDDDTQVYKDHGDSLTIAYQSGYYDGKKAAQRPLVGLTDEEKDGKRVLENGLLFNAAEVQAWELGVEYAEAKLKEKNI
jgi:hypothetical protein